jgi:UDP-N-acetylmuramoyl-L-alanyl-D-glutamate--2,6-diaminopimelate ligase
VINNTRGITVVVDFAHKPNALENVLQTARKENPKGRIIALFGCAGERDVQKRAMMGEISGRLADITVVTAEDPRSENVIDISNQIISGLQKSGAVEMHAKNNNKAIHRYVSLPDRTEAIQFAIRKLAKKGDTVLCLGKGHEQSMCYGKKEYPWDEFAAIQTALAV